MPRKSENGDGTRQLLAHAVDMSEEIRKDVQSIKSKVDKLEQKVDDFQDVTFPKHEESNDSLMKGITSLIKGEIAKRESAEKEEKMKNEWDAKQKTEKEKDSEDKWLSWMKSVVKDLFSLIKELLKIVLIIVGLKAGGVI